MKQKFLLKVMLLLCALVAGSSSVWAVDTYKLVKNVSELAQGDVILITSAKDGSAYALGNTQNSNNRSAESVSISEEIISSLGDAQEVTLESKSEGNFTLKVGDNSYLYAANSKTGNSNYLRSKNDDAIYWSITVNTTTYIAAITDVTSDCNSRNKLKYNSSNTIYSCYSAADNNLFIFKKQASTGPTIAVSKTSLSDFSYRVGCGPSTTKTFTVSGSNLTANISLSLGESNYEMCLTEDGEYSNSLSLTPYTGTVAATTVYVRLKAGLAINASYAGTITLSSTDATNRTVELSGSVTECIVTWDLSKKTYDNIVEADIVTWSSPIVTMTNSSKSGGTSASNYLGGDANNRTSSRFYANNTLTLSPVSGYAITSVVFTATSNDYATALKNSSWTNATATVSEKVVTVTPTIGIDNVSATIGATCGFTKVEVYYAANSSDIVPINPAKEYTTLTSKYNLDFTGLAGLKAYIVEDNDISDNAVTLTQVNKVPANKGLVLKATTPGSAVNVPVFDGTGADDVTGNLMAGSATTTTTVAANEGYILKDGAFHPSSGANALPAGKAYLNIAVPAGAPVLNLNFGGETTGIDSLTPSPSPKGEGSVYNLAGQRVANPTKGLYIVNGKKVIIK